VVKNTTLVSNASDFKSNLESRYAVKMHERDYLEVPPMNVDVSLIGTP